MKLPNGYGSVSKLSGSRRRPFIVRKNGKIIGYTSTREDGLILLADYNKKPWDVDKREYTFSQVYELWTKTRAKELSPVTKQTYGSAYNKHCKTLYKARYRDLRTVDFVSIIENCGRSNSIKNTIRGLFRHLDKTALEYDIIDKEYSSLIKSKIETPKEKTVFSEDEIKVLWEHCSDPDVDLVLILLYTGFRRTEFLNITEKDIDLKNWTIIGGIKTEAGKNRIVPVHERIRPFILNRINNSDHSILFPFNNSQFAKLFKSIMDRYGMEHTPHECRHTFRTRLDYARANKVCINKIIGHKNGNTGEDVYVHKTLEDLHETIALLP